MITWSQVYLEDESSLELVGNIIYSGQGILSPDGNHIQQSVVNAHSHATIFFLTNNTRAPQGEALEWINLLSSNSATES